MPHDEREVGQRLDVLHQSRVAAQAMLGDARRHPGRHRYAVLDPVHQRARLARDEPARRGEDPDRNRVIPGAPALGDRLVNDLAYRTMGHDQHLPGPGQSSGEHRPIQHQMRLPGQQHLVLRAGWLALSAIGDDHRAARPGRHRGQLPGGGEPGTAPAGEPGPADLGDELLPASSIPADRGQPTMPGQVTGQGGRATAEPFRQQPG